LMPDDEGHACIREMVRSQNRSRHRQLQPRELQALAYEGGSECEAEACQDLDVSQSP